MDNLKDTEDFGQNFKKEEDIERFFSKLLQWIERRIFNRISKRVNYLLNRTSDNYIEVFAPGNTGKDQNGNWRWRNDGTDFKAERRESDVWVFKGGFSP